LSDLLRPTYDFALGDLAADPGPRGHIYRSILPGSRVLDVGCDTGRLGELLIREKHAVVHGIERDPVAAAKAQSRLNAVWQRGVDAPDSFLGLGGPYDAILFLDVLEHLFDPWAVLRGAVGVLRPGGVVHALVPNIAHVSVVRRLLQGRFDYADFGTMDRTHVRWFTRASIARCFADSGLQRVSVRAVPLVPHVDVKQKWGERLSRALAFTLPDAFAGSLHAIGFAPTAP
jgi:2-polyprenyl-3-methyl-5-hydroxy-6-metoxy-1,4-benzoquinol methylase